jgi:hypothetical protein
MFLFFPPKSPPFYLNFTFWAVLIAFFAFLLPQYPWLLNFMKRKSLEIDFHDRVGIAHTFGNPNIHLLMSLRNRANRPLTVEKISIRLRQSTEPDREIPGYQYRKDFNQSYEMFLPFTLKGGESWTNWLQFFQPFSGRVWVEYLKAWVELRIHLNKKIQTRKKTSNTVISPDEPYVRPFVDLFESMFIWNSVTYAAEIIVEVRGGPIAKFLSRKNLKSRTIYFTIDPYFIDLMRDEVGVYSIGEGVFAPSHGLFVFFGVEWAASEA